jgi:hypothetical protein
MKANSKINSPSNFWTQLETKQISKDQIEPFLITKLGSPTNSTQNNLLAEIVKKINAYYFATEIQNNTVFSLIGTVEKASDIIEKKFKEGKNRGQTYYVLKAGEDKLQALQENLPADKLNQIRQLDILGQNLVFKWKKWITNKQLLDFYPVAKKAPK